MFAVFSISDIIRYINSNHRMPLEELEDIIRYIYILGLKEYDKTNLLFRYEKNEIDADIWKNVPINHTEATIISETFSLFNWYIYSHLEYIIEQSLFHFTKEELRNKILHIEYIEVRGNQVYIIFKWE